MELHIKFFKNKESPNPIGWATCNLSVPIERYDGTHYLKGTPIKWGGLDTVYVEANIDYSSQEDVDNLFKLSLAFNPDFQPVTNANGRFIDENSKVYRMQLLRGAAGVSYLRLLRRASTAAEFKEIVRYEIYVKPSPEKRAAMELMVDELITIDPAQALSTTNGLSKAPLKRKWVAGAGSISLWRLPIKCDEMEKVIRRMRPHLNAIRNESVTRLMRREDKRAVCRVRRWTLRGITQLSSRGGNEEHKKISTYVLDSSFDIPVHRAINDFLLKLMVEASEMRRKVNESIEDDKLRISGIPSIDKWEPDEITKEIGYKRGFCERLLAICNNCKTLLTDYYPWSGCGRCEVTALSLSNVPNTSAYTSVYFQMLRYSQKRFFMEALEGCFLIPQYEREINGTPSTWQKNYAYIYESWVFLRLAMAFQEEGFETFGESFRDKIRRNVKAIHLGPTANEPIRAISRDGKLQIDLFHGIRAYHQSATTRPEFFSVWRGGKKESIETPDFAIVFTNPKGKAGECRFNWIVLDSKAWPKLGKDAIKARDKYAEVMRRWNKKGVPDQSWLVYSGAFSDKDFPDIEFDPNVHDQLPSWEEDIGNPIASNDGMTWDPEQGIEGRTPLQPKGHIRANVLTIGKHDIFRDFARGQIATARKRLGL